MKSAVINFVVSWLETIAVIAFLLFPLLGLIVGGSSNGILGAILGLLLATIFGVLLFGVLFIMIQNNQILKDIRASQRS